MEVLYTQFVLTKWKVRVQRSSRLRRRLKLRDLDTFAAVARHRSMAKAATQLSISVPAVSKAIAAIEHTLGVSLLDRNNKGVEANLYGQALLKWIVAVFDDIQQGVSEIEQLTDPGSGNLRIGASEPMFAGILPVILGSLLRDHPRITVEVNQTRDGPQQYAMLRDRDVDLIVGRVLGSAYEDELSTETMFDDPLFVVAGTNNPLARRRKIELAELSDHLWALPAYEQVVGSFVAQAFLSRGVSPPKIAIAGSSIQMQIALLSGGRFLGMFPRSVLTYSAAVKGVVKMLPISFNHQPAPIGITAWRNRSLSPVAQLFIERFRAHGLSGPAQKRTASSNPNAKSTVGGR
jgi:DNA-binding transcriptional LysR family regulator